MDVELVADVTLTWCTYPAGEVPRYFFLRRSYSSREMPVGT